MDKIGELRRERELLLERVAVIEHAIRAYDDWEAAAEVALGRTVPTPTTSTDVVRQAQPENVLPTPLPEFMLRVEEVLHETPRPLARTALLEALEARGVVVGGVDARNTLSARMSRLENITNLPGFGYWPKDRPFAPAGYLTEPDHQPDNRAQVSIFGEADPR